MNPRADFVTVVSGLPRSGTSMMMRILEAGGIPPVVDELRTANEDNPLGYYEYEPVKALKSDSSWVPGARGKSVKIIYKLVYELPPNVAYRIVFMQRDVAEVVRSQEKMLEREGLDPGQDQRDMIIQMFLAEVTAFRNWAKVQPNIAMLTVDYGSMVQTPAPICDEIEAFLGGGLDTRAMATVVDPALYRNRA